MWGNKKPVKFDECLLVFCLFYYESVLEPKLKEARN